ncbi:hypothetical protein O181_085226, partial [Austropuccinia psidii MF-1]|nr:hypothetical protein [Austropuccinia psidii MF-1]
TVIITQNNQPEPISSELINLDISDTLQKAKNLANDQEPAITPQAAPKKGHRHDYGRSQSVIEGQGSVDDFQINKLCNSEAYNTVLPSKKADTATRSLSVHLKTSQKAYNNASQNKEYQILADLCKNCMNSYLTVRRFLGHLKTCKLLNGWHPLMEKKNMMLLTAEWRKNNPSPPKQMPKTAPIARSSNSNVKKQPQAPNKGKGKAPATKPYSQGYSMLWKMYLRWSAQ